MAITNAQLLEEIQSLQKSVKALQTTPEPVDTLTEAEKALLAKLEIELPEPAAPESEELKLLKSLDGKVSSLAIDVPCTRCADMDAKIDALIRWLKTLAIVAVIALGFLMLSSFDLKCNGEGSDKQPVSKVIYVDSQAEMDVILSALDIVGNEWANEGYGSVAEAREGLDALMGGKTGGVNQTTQLAVLACFPDGADFTAAIDGVKKNFT